MNLFANASLKIKIFIAPAIVLLLICAFAAASYTMLSTQQAQLSNLRANTYAEYEAVVGVDEQLAKTHMRLFRLVAWTASGMKGKTVEDATKDIGNNTDALKTQVQKLVALQTGNDAYKTLPEAIEKYVKSTRDVIDFADVDASMAVIAINQSDAIFNELDKRNAANLHKTHSALVATLALLEASAEQQKNTTILFSIACIVLGSFVALLIGAKISNPLVALSNVMKSLSAGDLQAQVPAARGRDEVAQMVQAVAVFRDGLVEAKRLEGMSIEEQTRKIRRQEAVDMMISDFQENVAQALEGVAVRMKLMVDMSGGLNETATETSRAAEVAAGASEEASHSVQTVASAADQLNSSVEEINHQINQTSQVISQATQQAAASNDQVQLLAQAASKIGDIVNLIRDIAEQTNLLALNATIEAARAGEAGKGFAVVASEVKTLASQTAKATEEISTQIAAIQNSTKGTVESIQLIGTTMESIEGYSNMIAAAVQEQSASTMEISRNIAHAAEGSGQVAASLASFSNAASQTSVSASQMLETSNEITKVTEQLKSTVDDFLSAVKAA